MTNTKLGKILSALMAKKGLHTSKLARYVGVPQPTIHRIATGNIANPHLSSLKPIADFFSITVDQLKGLDPIPELDQVQNIPLLNWDQLDKNSRAQSKDLIITDAKVAQNAFALTVKDASMEPIFPKGTVLIVDPMRQPKDRSYVIIKLTKKKEAIFRQLIINGDNSYLKPLSPDLENYKLLQLNKADSIIGIVVQARHNYEE